MSSNVVERLIEGAGPQDGSSEPSDVGRRRAYLLLPGLLATPLAIRLVIEGFGIPYWGAASPTVILLLAAMFVGVWRRWVSLWAFEVALLVVLVAVLYGFLVTWRVAPDYVAAQATDFYLVMLWSGLAFPLAFLVLGTRRGLRACVGIYAAFVLLTVPPIAAGVPSGAPVNAVSIHVSLAVHYFVMIMLLRVLASRLEALATARAAARLFAIQAQTDALTGLPNRRQLDDELQRHTARAHRHQEPLSVLLVDIDHFKAVNDRHGHQAGDRVLQQLARRLAETVRAGDVAGRWGGEEFLLIAPNTDRDAALELGERCRSAVSDTAVADVGKMTASVGVATLTEYESAGSVVRRADAALYVAKNEGRDAVAGSRGTVI